MIATPSYPQAVALESKICPTKTVKGRGITGTWAIELGANPQSDSSSALIAAGLSLVFRSRTQTRKEMFV